MPDATQPHVLYLDADARRAHPHAALLQRALERLGCRVSAERLDGGGVWSRLTGGKAADRLARALEGGAPDLVLTVGGAPVPGEVITAVAGAAGLRWTHWYPDIPGDPVAMEEAVRGYDRVFLPGTAAAAWYGARSARSFDALAPGCDPSVHRPMRVRETPLRSNVTFVGEASPWRETMLAELVDFGLTVWGPGWRSTALRDYCLDDRLSDEDANRAIAGSTVAVTLQREAPGPDGPPRTVTARLFETAAMGVPQVVDMTDDLAEHFAPGPEVVAAEDPATLRAAVKRLLYHHAERDAMAASARRRALGSHTYMHRMREVVKSEK